MKFIHYLSEEQRLEENYIGLVEKFPLFVNPTKDDYKELRKASGVKGNEPVAVRYIIDLKTKKFYVFGGYDAIHFDAFEVLKKEEHIRFIKSNGYRIYAGIGSLESNDKIRGEDKILSFMDEYIRDDDWSTPYQSNKMKGSAVPPTPKELLEKTKWIEPYFSNQFKISIMSDKSVNLSFDPRDWDKFKGIEGSNEISFKKNGDNEFFVIVNKSRNAGKVFKTQDGTFSISSWNVPKNTDGLRIITGFKNKELAIEKLMELFHKENV